MDEDEMLSPEAVAELKHMEEKELNLRRGVARKRAVGSPPESPIVDRVCCNHGKPKRMPFSRK